MYRMATALAPYASHPELTQFHGQVEECAAELAAVGAQARRLGIRLSTSPGAVHGAELRAARGARAAVAELEVQAALLDAMELGREAVVVLHVGGRARRAGAPPPTAFWPASSACRSAAGRAWCVENDDRVFGVADVLAVAARAGCAWCSTSITTTATTRRGSATAKRSSWH